MHRLRLPGLVLLAAVLTLAGWWLINTKFMPYDDEGYVLQGMVNFSSQGGLYDRIFTQYGPAPFLYYDTLHRMLGVPITHELGRTVTLIHWVGSALLAGFIAWRLSRRYWTAWVTAVAAFGYLWQMTSEPSHPGSLIAFLTALGLAGAIEALLRGRAGLAAGIFGAIAGVLVLTKINVGLLWCVSAGVFLLLNTGEPAIRRRCGWLALLGLGLLPFVLMRPLLGEAWVITLAVIFAGSTAAVVGLLEGTGAALFSWRDWLAGLAAFAIVVATGVAVTLGHGTSLAGLIDGVLIQPLRHPVNFHLGFTWLHWLAWPLLLVALTVSALWRYRPAQRPWLADAVAVLRLVAFGGFLLHLETWLTIEGVGRVIGIGLQLAPIFLLPLRPSEDDTLRRQALGLVALVSMGQLLHTYPVSGSQMGWGTFLLLPLFAVGLADTTAHLAHRLRQTAWMPLIAGVALAAVGLQLSWLLETGWQRWRGSQALGLPGCETVRPPENIRSALRILTTNAQLHADVLFSRPGMYSFNLWSGVHTPTLRNATHWFWILSDNEQRDIVRKLESTPRTAVITFPGADAFLTDTVGMRLTGPLIDELNSHYRTLLTISGYDFLVPRDSPAVPFLVAENFTRRAEAGKGEASLITVNVAARATVARVVVRHVSDSTRNLRVLDSSNCQVVAEPINSRGESRGASRTLSWPLQLEGLYRLNLYHHAPDFPTLPGYQLFFLDAEGRSLLEACYNDPSAATVSAPPAGG